MRELLGEPQVNKNNNIFTHLAYKQGQDELVGSGWVNQGRLSKQKKKGKKKREGKTKAGYHPLPIL